jgi:outer membrane protein
VKNLSLVLNVILLIAVGVLYVLHFTGGEKNEAITEVQASVGTSSALRQLAYVNSDSLLQNYDYFKDKANELEAKRAKLEAEYTNRAQGLQNEINDFQRNVQNMTMAQARAVEENLTQKQQNLIRYQQTLQQELMNDENLVNNELYDNVANYLEEYGRKNNLQLVLTYTKGSGVLYANDSLDITQEVIVGLNAEYNKKNNKQTNNNDTTEAK